MRGGQDYAWHRGILLISLYSILWTCSTLISLDSRKRWVAVFRLAQRDSHISLYSLLSTLNLLYYNIYGRSLFRLAQGDSQLSLWTVYSLLYTCSTLVSRGVGIPPRREPFWVSLDSTTTGIYNLQPIISGIWVGVRITPSREPFWGYLRFYNHWNLKSTI